MKIIFFKNITINMSYFLTCNLFTDNVEQNKTHINIILQVPDANFGSEINIRIEDFTEEKYYSNFKSYIDKSPVEFMTHIKIMIDQFLINSQSNCLDLRAEIYNLLNELCSAENIKPQIKLDK